MTATTGRVLPPAGATDGGLGMPGDAWPEIVGVDVDSIAQISRLQALGAISAGQVVSYVGEAVSVASASLISDATAICGVARANVANGGTAVVARHGFVTGAGWTWTPGAAVYLGEAGAMTQTPPTGGGIKIGFAITAMKIFVNIQAVAGTQTITIADVAGLQDELDAKADSNELGAAAYLGVGVTEGTVADGFAVAQAFQAVETLLGLKEDKSALKGAAYKNVGTGADDVAAGDHSHAISKVTGLQSALDLKAPLASPEFSGIPLVPTAAAGTNTTQAASTAFVQTGLSGKLSGAYPAEPTGKLLNDVGQWIDPPSGGGSIGVSAFAP